MDAARCTDLLERSYTQWLKIRYIYRYFPFPTLRVRAVSLMRISNATSNMRRAIITIYIR
jgi:hypothetical protein